MMRCGRDDTHSRPAPPLEGEGETGKGRKS